MNLLKKCRLCNIYTLKKICGNCNQETSSAHYKFSKLKDAPSRRTTFKK